MAYVREERGQEGEEGEGEEREEGEEGEEGECEGNMIPNGDAMILSVPHTDGGTFVASFSHVRDNIYQFVDAYRNTVYIMMSTSDRVSLMNRLTDSFAI